MASTEPQLDPELLVTRIIAELQANPTAQRLLLRAMLTNEFLGVPARLDRIEQDIVELNENVSRLNSDVEVLKADVAELKVDVAELKVDVGHLKGDSLEAKLPRWIIPALSQGLSLRRARIVQGGYQATNEDFLESVESNLESGVISEHQAARIQLTDTIVRARKRDGGETVWVAVEASNKVHQEDITRCLEAADALRRVFGEEALPVVTGYSIDPPDKRRADGGGVVYLEVVGSR